MRNYFELLGLKPSFALDASALQRAYVAAQQRFHPDRQAGASEAARAEAIQASMDANEAYETLKNPLGRAEHLLALEGVVVNTDERDTHKPSQALLMDMLELRENLSQAAGEADAARQVQDLREAMRRCEASLGEAFTQQAHEVAAQQAIRLRYLGKALEEAMAAQYRLKETASL